MTRYEHGRILAVNEESLGSELSADHASGVTLLTVEDAADFDELGGWLKIGEQVTAYTSVDDDTGVIAIQDPLSAAGAEGDRVLLWDSLRGVVSTEKVAEVALDGEGDNPDPLEASVADHLADRLPEGIRGATGESVKLELDGDEWRIVDVLGLAQAAPGSGGGSTLAFRDSDVLTVAATGTQTATLTYVPIPGSLHVRWNELPQQPTEYSVDGRTVTVPDPAGVIVVGDRLWFMYAYDPAAAVVDEQPPTPDSPWWEGDPAQGSVWGYPLSYRVWKDWGSVQDPTQRTIHTRGSVVMEFTDPTASFRATPVWRWPQDDPMYWPDPDGNGASAGDFRAGNGGPNPLPRWLNGHIKDPWDTGTDYGYDLTPSTNGKTFWGDSNSGMYSRNSAYTSEETYYGHTQDFFDLLEPLGVQITHGTETVNATNVGTTNGSKGRFWLGKQIKTTADLDPTDVGAVATPYLT